MWIDALIMFSIFPGLLGLHLIFIHLDEPKWDMYLIYSMYLYYCCMEKGHFLVCNNTFACFWGVSKWYFCTCACTYHKHILCVSCQALYSYLQPTIFVTKLLLRKFNCGVLDVMDIVKKLSYQQKHFNIQVCLSLFPFV